MTAQADDLRTLSALNSRFIHNFVSNDVAGHDAILHPSFRTVTSSTYVRTDGAWLCCLAQLTPVAPANYPADDTIVVRYLRGKLQPSNAARDA